MAKLWQPKHPVWFRHNDDSKIGRKLSKEAKAMQKENEKMAKELGYPRGVKQMKEEGYFDD